MKELKKKKVVAFSATRFAEYTRDIMNDVNATAKISKTKDGEQISEEIPYVKEFRKQFIQKPLLDNGVDTAQAENYADTVQFTKKQSEAMYPLVSSLITEYMQGRNGDAKNSFKFLPTEKFNGRINLKHIDEATITSRNPSTGEQIKTLVKEHDVLVKKSSAPKICKTRLK